MSHTLVRNKTVDRRCSNYTPILDLTLGFIELVKDQCKTRLETIKFMGFVVAYVIGTTVDAV